MFNFTSTISLLLIHLWMQHRNIWLDHYFPLKCKYPEQVVFSALAAVLYAIDKLRISTQDLVFILKYEV
jgi:hypothetical protein